MADLETAEAQNTSEEDGKNTESAVQEEKKGKTAAETKPGASAAAASEEAVTFSPAQQALMERVIEERLTRQRSQFEKQKKDAEAKAEALRLAEQGEFKMLADQRLQRITELENEIRDREINTLRATVAARHRLPEHWIPRLVGETETELDADAARIARDLAPPKAPNTEGGEKRGGKQTLQQRVEELKKSGDYLGF